MEVTENEHGGKSIVFRAGDDLKRVPRSHRSLITEEVAEVFRNVPGFFSDIAERTPFPRMTDWLMALVWENDWRLTLERSRDEKTWGRTAFWWASKSVRGAGIGLVENVKIEALPEALSKLYSLIGSVDWMGGASSAGIDRISAAHLLTAYDFDFRGDPIDPERTVVWGGFNGDMLIADLDGDRAGWFELPPNEVRMIGTTAETIDWFFAELLAGRGPTVDNVNR